MRRGIHYGSAIDHLRGGFVNSIVLDSGEAAKECISRGT